MSAPVVKILLVEDDPLWQDGVSALLASQDDLELVGIADNYDEGMSVFDATQPNVVLLDWEINGDRDGLALGASLVEKGFSEKHIILVTGSDVDTLPQHPFHLVPKPELAKGLIGAIRTITSTHDDLGQTITKN